MSRLQSDERFKKQVVATFKILSVTEKDGKYIAHVELISGIKVKRRQEIDMVVGKSNLEVEYSAVKVTVEPTA